MPQSIAERADGFARHLMSLLPAWDLSRADPEKAHIYESVLAGFLRLMREAIQVNREEDARNFYTQLYHHESHRHRFRMQRERVMGYGGELGDSFQVARLVAAGWCVRTLKERDGERVEAARTLLACCTQIDYGVPELMRLWRLAHRQPEADGDEEQPTVLERLGVTQWESEMRVPSRPGFSEMYHPDYSWQLDGVYVLMLHQDPAAYIREEPEAVTEKFWDTQHLRSRLEQLATATWLGLDADTARGRIEAIVEIIESQELGAAKEKLRRLAGAPLDPEKWNKLEQYTCAQYDVGKLRSSELSEAGLALPKKGTPGPALVRRRWNLHKEDLARGFHAAYGTAEILSTDVALHQDITSFGLVEQTLGGEDVGTLVESLSDSIRGALVALSEGGWNPNVLIIPRGIEMRRALCSAIKEPSDSTDEDEYHYGPVKSAFGLSVIEWPYVNPRSIVVCDSKGLIARVWPSSVPPRPKLTLISSNDDDAAEILRRAEHAERLADIPATTELRLLVEVSIAPILGVADPDAGRAIPLPEAVKASIDARDG